MSANNNLPLYGLLGVFAIYQILKWSCRLIFGLLDYAMLIGAIGGIIWYLRLPAYRKCQLLERIKNNIKSISRKLGLD